MSNKEDAVKAAKQLFNANLLANVGGGYYRYTETPSKDYQGDAEPMISRKGLEREASLAASTPLTLISRNDVESTLSSAARHRAGLSAVSMRVTILQHTPKYEADQERSVEAKAQKLITKYAKQ